MKTIVKCGSGRLLLSLAIFLSIGVSCGAQTREVDSSSGAQSDEVSKPVQESATRPEGGACQAAPGILVDAIEELDTGQYGGIIDPLEYDFPAMARAGYDGVFSGPITEVRDGSDVAFTVEDFDEVAGESIYWSGVVATVSTALGEDLDVGIVNEMGIGTTSSSHLVHMDGLVGACALVVSSSNDKSQDLATAGSPQLIAVATSNSDAPLAVPTGFASPGLVDRYANFTELVRAASDALLQ